MMKTDQIEHPDRQDLLKAVKSGRIPFKKHLESCENCQLIFSLFSSISNSKSFESIALPPGLAARHRSIPRIAKLKEVREVIKGIILFDSWANSPQVAMRSNNFDADRRLRFQAGEVTLELVAERHGANWEFSARVCNEDEVSSNYILQIGKMKLGVGAYNCFHWSSKNPPKKIQLLSPETKVEIGALQW